MTATRPSEETKQNDRPPFWRDVRVLGWVIQIAVFVAVVGFVAWLIRNFQHNSETLGIPTGFEYLDQPANFPIAGSDFKPAQSVADATLVGIRNTIYVVVVGIVLATILGVLIGIARLSGNWLLSKAATVYVETVRNIPLLVLLTFTYLALVLSVFPRIENAWGFDNVAVISNRAVAVPWFEGSAIWMLLTLLGGMIAAWAVSKWRQGRSERTGKPAGALWWTLGGFAFGAISIWVIGGLTVTTPVLTDGQLTGGMAMTPEYLALLLALTLYTASHIAEIVRGSIQAVPKGQTEAADALALNGTQAMVNVVLPQAMRIAIPPLGNQYLNLFKNSSLAVVISYFELTKVTLTAVGNGQPAVPAYALLMLLYLIGSLVISQFVNFINRRMALVEK